MVLKKFKKYIVITSLFCSASYSFYALGFDTLNSRADDFLEDGVLDLSIEDLMNVKVTSATKSEYLLNTAPSIINSYSAEDIRAMGAENLGDLLWTIAGVQVQENANNRYRTWFRGVQHEFNNKLLLYIDGVPIRGAFDDFSVDNEIPLESVKRIEVIRGPGSALYGANAFSGVISIFTYKAGERGHNLAKVEYGKDNTRTAYLSAEADLSSVKFSLEGKIWETDGQTRKFNRNGTTNTRPSEQSLDYLRAKASFLEGKLNFSATASNFYNQRTDKGINNNGFREHDTLYVNADYIHRFSERSGVNINAYYTKAKRIEEEDEFELLPSGELGKTLESSYSFDDTVEVSGIHTVFDYTLSQKNKLIWGVEVQRNRILDSYYLDNVANQRDSFIIDPQFSNLDNIDYGLFVQDSHSFNEDTTITASIRYDILDIFDNQLSYRLGLVHSFNSEFFGKLLFGTAYRSPSSLEYVRAPIDSALPDVETVETWEAQIGRQTKEARYTLTAFRNRYQDFIARQNSFQDQKTLYDVGSEVFTNLDNQTIHGLEFESRFKVSRHWQPFMNVSWLKAHSDAADQDLPLLADWTLAAGVDWRKRMGIGEWLIHNHIVAYGDRGDWPSKVWNEGQQQRYDGRLDSFSDGFVVWNFGTHYLIKSGKAKGLDLGLTVKNVTDEIYYSQSSIVPSPSRPAYWDTQYDSRHIQFSLSYQW